MFCIRKAWFNPVLQRHQSSLVNDTTTGAVLTFPTEAAAGQKASLCAKAQSDTSYHYRVEPFVQPSAAPPALDLRH